MEIRSSLARASRFAAAPILVVLMVVLAVFAVGCGGGATTAAVDGVTASTGAGGAEGGGTAPTPGATLSGPIEISGVASAAVISLVVSADGSSVSSVSVVLTDLKTETFSAGSMTKAVSGSIPIEDGHFSGPLSGLGTIEGTFSSPTEASGTVDLSLEIPFSTPAALGECKWTASTR